MVDKTGYMRHSPPGRRSAPLLRLKQSVNLLPCRFLIIGGSSIFSAFSWIGNTSASRSQASSSRPSSSPGWAPSLMIAWAARWRAGSLSLISGGLKFSTMLHPLQPLPGLFLRQPRNRKSSSGLSSNRFPDSSYFAPSRSTKAASMLSGNSSSLAYRMRNLRPALEQELLCE